MWTDPMQQTRVEKDKYRQLLPIVKWDAWQGQDPE
jgi:hypothetical protein